MGWIWLKARNDGNLQFEGMAGLSSRSLLYCFSVRQNSNTVQQKTLET